jgi:hypothetical protein
MRVFGVFLGWPARVAGPSGWPKRYVLVSMYSIAVYLGIAIHGPEELGRFNQNAVRMVHRITYVTQEALMPGPP